MSTQEPVTGQVVIRDQPVVDFSHLTEPAQLAAVARIDGVAIVIVPEALAGAYLAIPASNVAATMYVPGAVNVRVHTGSLVVSGDGIGGADDVLVVVGMLIITSQVTGPVPQRIHVIGSVLAPRGSEQALGRALAGGTGNVSYYQYSEGQDIKLLSGQVKLSAAMLANTAGQPGDLLIVAGQVAITGEVAAVGYRHVIFAGQVAAPAASRDVIEPSAEIQGQIGWYAGSDARVFHDDLSLGPDFFRLANQPVSLVVFGDLSVEAGVSDTALLEKIAGLVVFGDVTAPPGLIAALQVLGAEVFGDIRAGDGQGS
jgi:hypothetical protein